MRSMRSPLAVVSGAMVVLVVAACHSPPPSTAPDAGALPIAAASSSSVPAASASAPVAPAPPAPLVACTRNEDCAVARVDVRGKTACCAGCATTPGTRAWYAELQLWCGAHPPAECPALACPLGPTRALCDHGRCQLTSLSPEDGGPDFIVEEDKCLPALVCGTWAGCAKVRGDSQDGWYLVESPVTSMFGTAPIGTEAILEKDACTPRAPGKCAAARLLPKGVVCPGQTVPPLVMPPKPCVLTGTSCHA